MINVDKKYDVIVVGGGHNGVTNFQSLRVLIGYSN